MNKFAFLLLVGFIFAGCSEQRTQQICRILGTMESHRWDGQWIYLAPIDGPADAAHTDSVIIKDAKFEFYVDSIAVKVIRVSYLYRVGVQDLLVATEPGDVEVFIGKNSTSRGTAQNDSLQVWKDHLMIYNSDLAELQKKRLKYPTDTLLRFKSKQVETKIDSFNNVFVRRMPFGVVKDFMNKYIIR